MLFSAACCKRVVGGLGNRTQPAQGRSLRQGIRLLRPQDAGSPPTANKTHTKGCGSMLHDELRQEFIRRGMPADADDAAAAAWIADKYPCIDRLTRFFRIVYGESDRGCVICATAFIDDALATAIRLALKEMAEPPKRILDALLTKQPLPPLGSFAIRTKMARALGLIDDHTMAA